MWRDDATLLDIAQAARRIVSFVRGVDEASFAANEIRSGTDLTGYAGRAIRTALAAIGSNLSVQPTD
jgi:hypothetical protein